MFLAGNIPTKDQVQFGEFWSCLGIFRNSTNLQNKNKKTEIGKTYLAPPRGPPAGPVQPPLQRAAWLGQTGRQLLDGGRSVRHAAARRPASPSETLDELHVVPRTP